MSNAEIIWNFFKEKGLNDYACAGILGNAYAESGLNPQNLQNTYERKLGYTDTTYTQAVDNGTYTNFIRDAAGYGLFQFTYWSLKQGLLNYCKQHNKSIGDLEAQLEYSWQLFNQNYKSMITNLKNATSVLEASNAVLLKFERPADQSVSVQEKRASYGQKYYNQFANNKGSEIIMGHNTYTKGKKIQLSKYFVSTEFDCHGNGCCSTTILDSQLIDYLEKIREHFNAPITISSGYRCAVHNRNVGGATGSRHSKGDAADIIVKGHTPREVAQYAESIGIKGIGLYETNSDGYFVHIDTRPTKSFWYGQACAARTTFGGSTTQNTTTSGGEVTRNYYMLNDTGDGVKEIQLILLELGYTLTNNPNDKTKGADGIYGALTKKAVINFQESQGLKADGLAGTATIDALKKAKSAIIVKDDRKVEVTANVLNVRLGPGIKYAVAGSLKKGTQITLTEIENGWGKYAKGWVSLEYVKEVN